MGVLGTNFTRRSTAPRRHETLELQPIPGTETATWGGCDLGNSGVWDRDYGWGVRVRRHLAHAGGVLYGMELGSVTLKINNQHTPASGPGGTYRRGAICAGVWETPCDRSTLPSVYFG